MAEFDKEEIAKIKISEYQKKELEGLIGNLRENIGVVTASLKAHALQWNNPNQPKTTLIQNFKKLKKTLKKIKEIHFLKEISSELIRKVDILVPKIESGFFPSAASLEIQFKYFLNEAQNLINLMKRAEVDLGGIELLEKQILRGKI